MNTTTTPIPIAELAEVTRFSEAAPQFRLAPLCWLALGTFAVGTEAFMIAAILPRIATDLVVSLQATAQLVTIFALTYAISSPVLTALSGSFKRQKLLVLAMAAFAGANLFAATASTFSSLACARFLLALCAGLYTPNATALDGVLVPPGRRGTALAIVTGGTSLAVALGVPLGAFIGSRFGWRMTFVGVSILAFVALVGLLTRIPRDIGRGLSTATMRERIAVVRQPGAVPALLITTIWGVGTQANYIYIAPFLAKVAGFEGVQIGYVLFLWGTAAFSGLLLGGAANDRFGSHSVVSIALPTLGLTLASLSLWARFLTVSGAFVPVLIAVAVWGLTAWGFFPAQQARLISITGAKLAPVILSLNASFMYLGFSFGAVLGSITLTQGSLSDLGWVGALCELAALVLFLVTSQRRCVNNSREPVCFPNSINR
jgi:predicted MFS family arabinose efflux permease